MKFQHFTRLAGFEPRGASSATKHSSENRVQRQRRKNAAAWLICIYVIWLDSFLLILPSFFALNNFFLLLSFYFIDAPALHPAGPVDFCAAGYAPKSILNVYMLWHKLVPDIVTALNSCQKHT